MPKKKKKKQSKNNEETVKSQLAKTGWDKYNGKKQLGVALSKLS